MFAIYFCCKNISAKLFSNFIINDFQEKMHGISDVRPDFGGVTEGWSLLKTYSKVICHYKCNQ